MTRLQKLQLLGLLVATFSGSSALANVENEEVCTEALLVMEILSKGHIETIEANVEAIQDKARQEPGWAKENADRSADHILQARPHMKRLMEICGLPPSMR